ncbi:MAG: 50S ribosomal protein P1 [Candidatus Pacearchaeota archaeon]|jgi:large subunit ribosomal protein L12
MEYVYGALLLHKLGKEIAEANLKKVIEAAGVKVDESKIKSLIASLKGINIDQELENASLVAAAPSPSGSEAKAHEHKEEKKEDHHAPAAEGLSALFG